VEIRRVDNKLKKLSTKYGTEISNAQKAVMAKSSEVPYVLDDDGEFLQFCARALPCMLFYRGREVGRRRIDRDQVKLAFANQPDVYNSVFPRRSMRAQRARGKARLNVISFNGLSR
jgi:hypothetical protein